MVRPRLLLSACLVAAALAACTDGSEGAGAGATGPPTSGPVPSGPVPSASAEGGSATVQGPERTGERVRVLGVDGPAYSFQVFAQDAVGGVCLELQDGDGGQSLGCGFEVPERRELGFFQHAGRGRDGGHRVVVGSVVPDAVTVRVEFGSGEPVTGTVRPVPGLSSAAFGIDVGARDGVTEVVALAADGREVGRRSV